ncbi:MAG: cobalamin biosynthesis protein CobG [Pseudomonadota bacterium]
MSGAPQIKGWCPGAYTPMVSGDGLIFRIRPRGGRTTRAQMLVLADLAETYGNGVIDLTNRANLQLRGVGAADTDALVAAFLAAGLVDDDPEIEVRRNLMVQPDWQTGDLTNRLVQTLHDLLGSLPALPAKFGFAVDTGPAPLLSQSPADIRLERAPDGGVLVRADGAAKGRPVDAATVADAVLELCHWFASRMTPEARRMARVVACNGLPACWTAVAPAASAPLPGPGTTPQGVILGAGFGQIAAGDLQSELEQGTAPALRVLPNRTFLLEGQIAQASGAFIEGPDHPLLSVNACPGAPHCAAATVDTRTLARGLAARAGTDLHVSGCSKGCARTTPAALTVVGEAGLYNIIRGGRAGDTPDQSGLSAAQILSMAV